MTATIMGTFRFLLQCIPTLRSGLSDFSTFDLIAATYWTDLDQRHLRAKSEQNFLRFGGVGVVSVLVKPLLQRPRHVLQSLTLVSHFPPAGTTPIERKNIIRKITRRGKKGTTFMHRPFRSLPAATESAAHACKRHHYFWLAWRRVWFENQRIETYFSHKSEPEFCCLWTSTSLAQLQGSMCCLLVVRHEENTFYSVPFSHSARCN